MKRLAAMAALALFAGQLSAMEIMYGGVGRGSAQNPGGLLTVDQNNGGGTFVGDPIADGGLTGIDFDSGGTLWGSSIADADRSSRLVTIDPNTGGLLTSVALSIALSIGNLAIDANDTIYGIRSNAHSGGGGELYTIATDGTLALLGDTGVGRGGGIAFHPDGTLYFLEFTQLHTLNPLNGQILTTVNLSQQIGEGLAIRSDGMFFATDAGNTNDTIYTLNPLTGQVTALGPSQIGKLSDLAFQNAVPEPGSLVLASLGLLTVAGLRRRRRLS